MDSNLTVADLDVHKDNIYLCIMRHAWQAPPRNVFA